MRALPLSVTVLRHAIRVIAWEGEEPLYHAGVGVPFWITWQPLEYPNHWGLLR